MTVPRLVLLVLAALLVAHGYVGSALVVAAAIMWLAAYRPGGSWRWRR